MKKESYLSLYKIAADTDVPGNGFWVFNTPGDSIFDLNNFNKHYQKYDADPNTPGVQLKSGDKDNTADFISNPDTHRLAYHASRAFDGGTIEKYRKKVDAAMDAQYAEYSAGMKAQGLTPKDKATWIKPMIMKQAPLYYGADVITAMGRKVMYNPDGDTMYGRNGKYRIQNNWNIHAGNLYRMRNQFTNPDGSLNMENAQQLLLSNDRPGYDANRALKSLGITFFKDPAMRSAFKNVAPELITDDTFKKLDSYNLLTPDRIRSLKYVSDAQKDPSKFFTPEGRQHLATANEVVGDENYMGAIKNLSPKHHDMLTNNTGQIQFAHQNYEALNNLNDFRNNPLMFILRNLFTNPENLYSVIGSMGKMYNPQTDSDLQWNNYLVGGNKNIQGMSQYLPWMQLLGNIRSGFGGEGFNRFG